MRVSVVIPAYNCGELVVEAVRSVLAQTRQADEILVIDDGSTDDTPSRLAQFGPPVRVIRQPNGGVSAARNRGVAEATGELIGFLDGDDVWHPRKLEFQVPTFETRPDIGLLGTARYSWPLPAHPTIADDEFGEPHVIPFDRLAVRNCLVTSAVIVRAGILWATGVFDHSLQGPEDHDMWLRVARRTRVANLSAALTGYRVVPGSLSKDAARMETGMRAILAKLDATGVFQGRPLFRRKVLGYYRDSWGYLHGQAGHRLTAVKHMALSLLTYPLPYPSTDIRYTFGRLRLLLRTALVGTRAERAG